MLRMKVVSLAPNITQIIKDLGQQHKLVGCTEHTDTKSAEIIGSWLSPDYKQIKDLNPDIVFTSDGLQQDIKQELTELNLNVCHTEPERLSDLVDLIRFIGAKINSKEEATKVSRSAVERIHKVKECTGKKNGTVYCEEWDSPPMAAGNWVPDMVKSCGGSYPFVESGNRSDSITENKFSDSEPDVFISHICGIDKQQSFRSFRPEWNYEGHVYFIEDKYVNQLSTNTLKGLEAFAEIIGNDDFGRDNLYEKVDYKQGFEY